MDHPTLPVVGSHRLNQLGGAYINGKPLPNEIRHQILALAHQGFRPGDISRRLRITHGCISKLLSKYRKTGTIEAGGESAGRPRVITPRIAERIMEYRKEQPVLFSWEIRDRLVQESLCSKESLPSLSSISRLLKNKDDLDTAPRITRERNSNSHTIANILNLPPSNGQSSSSISSSMASTSINGRIAEQKQTENIQNNAEDLRETFPLRIQRRERIKYTSCQLHELETAFKMNQYPSMSGREHLARKIGVTESRIQVWFANQRSKYKARRHSTNETGSRPNELKRLQESREFRLSRVLRLGASRIFFPPQQWQSTSERRTA